MNIEFTHPFLLSRFVLGVGLVAECLLLSRVISYFCVHVSCSQCVEWCVNPKAEMLTSHGMTQGHWLHEGHWNKVTHFSSPWSQYFLKKKSYLLSFLPIKYTYNSQIPCLHVFALFVKFLSKTKMRNVIIKCCSSDNRSMHSLKNIKSCR